MKLKVEGDGEMFFIEETLDDASGKATVAADEEDWDISFEIHALGKMWIDGGRLCSRKKPWWDAIGAGLARLHRELVDAPTRASSIPKL
jgi:hypothetical protein